MSAAEFTRLTQALRPVTEHLYLHIMGEPLLHPQLAELLAIAGEQGFWVNITTNGTLLKRQETLLCAAPAVRKVSISLHSFEANAAQDFAGYLTVCTEFAKTAAAADKLIGLRLWNLNGTVEGENRLNEPILRHLRQQFPGEWQPVRGGYAIAERIYLEYGERFEWPDLTAEEAEVQFCYGLRDQLGVLCDGTVVPCCLDHEGEIALGNLLEQPLEEILSSPRAAALYEGFSKRFPTEELCRRCGYAGRFNR